MGFSNCRSLDEPKDKERGLGGNTIQEADNVGAVYASLNYLFPEKAKSI